jgi:tryptophanyl-tRNA synthetase
MIEKRIFSGIQPSGNLHIGNYLGAVKNWVKLQDEFESIFCVVDLHAITVFQNPEELKKKTIEVAKVYLASGINPEKSMIFIQSKVQEHAELAWILNTVAKVSELKKMTQFKDKAGKNIENVGMGLFDYPVLMAADILLYDTEKVPVGEDQVQHVELTRTLGKRFNGRFGETFVIPEPHITKEGMRIMGLDDPTKKMSKSAESEYNYIALADEADAIRKKIKKAVTDSGSEIKYQDDKPALKNLINIYSVFADISTKEVENKYAGKGYADFKNDLAEVIIESLKPIQEKMKALSDEEVLKILQKGAEKVRPIAKAKLDEVKKKLGFIL